MYYGIYEWNKTKKCDDEGELHQHRNPEDKWIENYLPDLRIISPELEEAVLARQTKNKKRPRYVSRPGRVVYLLSGIRCPCGGSFQGLKRGTELYREPVYECGARHRDKNCGCENVLKLPVLDTDATVLGEIEDTVLKPKFVDSLLPYFSSASNRIDTSEERAKLQSNP